MPIIKWRKGKLICCRNGLVKRGWNDLTVRIAGQPAQPHAVERMIAGQDYTGKVRYSPRS